MSANVNETKIPPEYQVANQYLVYDDWQMVTKSNSSLLKGLAGEVAITTLAPARRVRQMFQSNGVIDKRKKDIHTDIVGYERIKLSEDAVESGLRVIERLNLNFYSQIESVMERLSRRYRRIDSSEAIVSAQDEVRRRIFYSWNMEGKNYEELAWNLTGFVKIAIKYIHQDLTRLDNAPISFPGQAVDFELVGTGKTGLNQERRIKPLYQIFGYYAHAIDRLSLAELMGYIGELDLYRQVAILKKFGYFHPEEPMSDHYKRLNLSEKTTTGDLKFALAEIIMRIGKRNSPEPRIDIADMVDRADSAVNQERRVPPEQKAKLLGRSKTGKRKSVPYTEAGKNIPVYAARVQLHESRIIENEEWVKQLTEIEKRVLQLAMVCIDKEFLYSNAHIGEETGLTPTAVRNIVHKVNMLRRGEKSSRAKSTTRYINQHGETILHGYSHYILINKLEQQGSWSPEQMANLGDYQKEIIRFLTVPDSQGRYHSVDEAKQTFGFSDDSQVLKNIITLVEDTSFITDIRQKLDLAAKYKDLFNTKQKEILFGMIKALEEGISFRGNKLVSVSRYLGLSDSACNFFLYKALPKIMSRVVE